MIWGYDLDGTLCQGPPACPKKWGYMNGVERHQWQEFLLDFYKAAHQIYNPTQEKFYVITARKGEDENVEATVGWLNQYFPHRTLGIFMFTGSRSIHNVVEFKNKHIKENGITDFVEDNPKVVAGLRKKNSARIWLFNQGSIFLD